MPQKWIIGSEKWEDLDWNKIRNQTIEEIFEVKEEYSPRSKSKTTKMVWRCTKNDTQKYIY